MENQNATRKLTVSIMLTYILTLLVVEWPYASFNILTFNNLNVIHLSLYAILHGHNLIVDCFPPSLLKYNPFTVLCAIIIYRYIILDRKKGRLKTFLKINEL